MALFDDYEKSVDPLNWVVHRPAEFQFDTLTLVELPKKGLLTLINYLIAEQGGVANDYQRNRDWAVQGI